jgi:hypothetical protein
MATTACALPGIEAAQCAVELEEVEFHVLMELHLSPERFHLNGTVRASSCPNA